jgi:hypothetical protein
MIPGVVTPWAAESEPWFLSRIFALSKAWQKFESCPTVIYYDRWYYTE